MTTLISGYHGMRNFGDDLFRLAIERHAASLWPGEETRFIAPTLGSSSSLSTFYSRPSRLGSAVRAAATAVALVQGSRIAYCGGSIFQDVTGVRNLHRLSGRIGLTAFEGLGVSVGPFQSLRSRERVRNFTSTFDRLIVRDTSSCSILDDMGLESRLGGDLAALLDPAQDPVVTPAQRPIVVAPCASRYGVAREYIEGLITMISALDPEFTRPVVVAACNAHSVLGDSEVCHQVAEYLSSAGIGARTITYEAVGAERFIELLASSHVTIATRLHAGIVSYLNDSPVVFIAYHDKIRDFARDVGMNPALVLGMNDSCSRWRDAVEAIEHSRPKMTSEAYRQRAQAVYLGFDCG